MTRPPDTPPAALLWGGAGMVAAVVHLMLVQQGLAAMGNARAAQPPALPEIEVMAVASTVQGQDQPVETAKPVMSEALRPQSSAERVAAASPSADRAQTAGTAAAVAARPVTPTSAAAPRLAAVAPAPSLSPPAAEANRLVASAPSASPVAAPSAAPSPARLAPSVSTATVARPAAPAPREPGLSPVVTRPDSTATVTRPAAPAPRQPGLSPVATRPDSTATVARPAAPAPSQPAVSPVLTRPDSAATVAARPSAPARVAAAAPAAPAAPASNAAGRVAAVAPVGAVPPAAPSAAATPVAPVPSLPPPAETTAREGIAAPLPETAPEAPANENTYDAVLDHLAELAQPACFAAMPSLSDEGAFQLEVFARDAADLTEFRNRLETRVGQRMPNTTMKPISADQCAVMAFLTEGPSYPRFKLFFDIPQRVILSGEALEGRIGNTSGGFITFLLVDDEGTVQDLATFLQFVPGGARFSIPLSLTAGPVETQQLLLVLSTPARLRTVETQNGTKAASFFPQLAAELRERGQTEDAAIVAFSVR